MKYRCLSETNKQTIKDYHADFYLLLIWAYWVASVVASLDFMILHCNNTWSHALVLQEYSHVDGFHNSHTTDKVVVKLILATLWFFRNAVNQSFVVHIQPGFMETRRSAPLLFYRVGLRNSMAFPLTGVFRTKSEIADLLKYTDHFRLHSLDSKFYIFLRITYTIQLIQQN